MKRIWIVTELFYPETFSTGHILTKIAEGLAQYYKVGVLTRIPDSDKSNILNYEEYNNITIHRFKTLTTNVNKLILRIINSIMFSFLIFWKILFYINKGDIILVVTNPPSLPFIAAFASWLKGAKSILIIHDVYPDVLVAINLIKKNSLITKLFDYLTRYLYNSVAHIIVLGRDMKKIVSEKLIKNTKIDIITNWADLLEIFSYQRKTNSLLSELGIQNKFVVQYSGNMGRTHGLEILVDASQKLIEIDKIHFLFIGTGAKRMWLERTVVDYKLKNVTLLPPQPKSDLCDTLNACDVAIISFIPGMSGLSVPSRMYNILAAGKPIIAVTDPDSELAMLILEENIGWIVAPNNPDELVATILEANKNNDTLIEMGKRCRVIAEKKYSLNVTINAYRNIIESVSKSRT